jgi:hypothetical protein
MQPITKGTQSRRTKNERRKGKPRLVRKVREGVNEASEKGQSHRKYSGYVIITGQKYNEF